MEEVAQQPQPHRLAPPGLDREIRHVPHLNGAVRRLPRGHLHAVVERHGVGALQPREPHAGMPMLRRGVRAAVADPEMRSPVLAHHAVGKRHSYRCERLHLCVRNVSLRRQHPKAAEPGTARKQDAPRRRRAHNRFHLPAPLYHLFFQAAIVSRWSCRAGQDGTSPPLRGSCTSA